MQFNICQLYFNKLVFKMVFTSFSVIVKLAEIPVVLWFMVKVLFPTLSICVNS